MSMVQLALKRPYTFIVMAMLIVLATPFALLNMATDIFPEINIPVISIVWNYTGLPAQEMGQRISAQNERSLTTTVSDIEHIESTSLAGIAIIKVFFQPTANIQTAIAQVVAIEQAQLRQLPPGITPPLVIKYSASSIPVIQLGLSSPTLPEQTVFDAAVNTLRPQLVTIPGVAIPFPYGGKNRLISVDLDMQALQARGLSPADVVNAVNLQNLILPSGTAKFGATEYTVRMNGSPEAIAGLNDLPVKTSNGTTTYLRDVAYVRDGFSPQTNIVRKDGARGVLLSVLKNGGASTLDIVANLRAILPRVQAILPADVKVTPLFDQSVFVKAAVQGVVVEALIAAGLTAVMVLLFLGNWRSTLIIALTIPLSILASILMLQALGETLNLMTLGGMALSVGILVDQAIVTIENIERHLHLGKPLDDAIIVGAGEIGVPAFVSTLCICIVFVPMFFLSGVARFLFVPLAEAVVFAMVASYLLSRTLVPTLVMLLMRGTHGDGRPEDAARPSPLQRVYRAFDRQFERVRGAYTILLGGLLEKRGVFGVAFLAFCLLSCGLYPFLGRDFFPSVDAGLIRLHMRAPTGTRIEETARLADDVESAIRQLVPKEELETILDNLGVPNSGINLSYSNAGTIGTLDGEIQLALKEGHRPTEEFVTLLRAELPKRFPGVEFFFQPADIVTQILNFGLPAAIDVQLTGNDLDGNAALAADLVKRIKQIPGAVDAHVHQRLDAPAVNLQMDRTRLQQMGLSAQNVGQNVLVSLSGSSQTAPAFWLNPVNGIVYSIAVQAPQYRVDSLDALLNVPVAGNSGGATGDGVAQRAGRVDAAARQPGRGHLGAPAGGRLALQHPAGDRRLRQRPGHRPGERRGAGGQARRRGAAEARARQPDRDARPGADDAGVVPRPRRRPGDGDRPRLPADRRQLPVVDRRRDHRRRAAGGARRDRLDALHQRHDAVGAGAHRRDHDDGRRHRQQHPAGLVRAPAAAGRRRAGARRARCRGDAHPAGADDGAGDDHRHDPDGARHRRRRRAECAARPRRHRRPAVRDGIDAAVRSGRLRRRP